MFTTIQEGIQAIQKQVLSDTPLERALYIPAQGKRTTYATEDAFDLYPAVSEFLKFENPSPLVGEGGRRSDEGLQKDSKDQKQLISPTDSCRKVLLLLGDTGSGKSLFCQDLITRLWQSYKPGNPIPLFVSLARLQDPIENAIEEALAAYGFSVEQIATLKKEQQFIFVLDGYDEIHQFKNLYVTNKLNEWQARTIITCRSQYLYYLSDTDKHFMPFHGEKRQPQLLQQFYVAPFSEKEIVAYLQQYERLSSGSGVAVTAAASGVSSAAKTIVITDSKDHKSDAKSVETPKPILYQQLISIPGLQSLITTPFLLYLAVEALPDILAKYKDSKDQKNIEQQKLTQAALYDVFIERWFKRQELKLKTSKHIDEKAVDPKPNFWKFCKELAVTMRTQNATLINYTPEKVSKFASATAQAKLNPWKQFFSEDQETELLRSACPIRKLGPNQYGFIHASLIEYFATRAMYEEVVMQQPSQQITISAVSAGDSKDEKLSIEITDQKSSPVQQTDLSPLPQSTLYQSSITKQNNMIQFLADRVQENEIFKKKLFEIIESSKTDERYAVGAANAITALNCGQVNFNGLDFNGIRIPGANLSGGLFDSTQLQQADLQGVNFQGAWLREANLSKATVANLHFGEWPFIQLEYYANACCYSLDGRWLAVACLNTITLYLATTRQLVQTFKGLSNINSIAFNSTGEQLASGDQDKMVRIWDVPSGKELRVLSGHTGNVNNIAWDSKDERLASGSDDNTVRIWEVISGKELCVLDEHTRSVNSIAWDSKGERLASGSNDNTVRIWDAVSGKELRVLPGHTGNVNSIAWDNKGERLASGSDKAVHVWEVSSGEKLGVLRGHTGKVNSVAWDIKDERLASGSDDQTVRVWEVASGKELRCFASHTQYVKCIAWDTKNESLASGGDDCTVRIWDIASNKELRCLGGHTQKVNSVAWDASNKRLASVSNDKTVRIWGVNGKELHCLNVNQTGMDSIAWDATGERVASGTFDCNVLVWEVSTGKELNVLEGHTSALNSIAWDAKSELLASGSSDHTVRIWNVILGKELCCFAGHKGGVRGVLSIAWDAKSERIASGGSDKSIRIWDVVNGKQLRVLQGHEQDVTSIAWDAKNERIASGSDDTTVRIWKVASGKQLHVLKGHTGSINNMGSANSVAWDTKGEHLASASSDQTVRIWDAETGKELYCLNLPQSVSSCCWGNSVDGNKLLSVAFGSSVACFVLKQVKNNYQATLCWLSAPTTILFTSGLNFTDVNGLIVTHYKMLRQRSAIGKPTSLTDEKGVVLSPSLTQLAIQHSSVFSASTRNNKQAIEIGDDAKNKNDSSCAPCCSLM